MFVTYVFPHISQQYIKWGKNNDQYRVRMLEYITAATFDSLDFTMLMWFFQFNDSSIKKDATKFSGLKSRYSNIIDNDSNILLMGISAKQYIISFSNI